jgi:fumarate reductase flavoprotein subunit
MTLRIAGAGMAGLVAAARARELGLDPVVFEKGDRPGGSMLLSSGVVWRHRTLESFHAECPAGEPALQRLVIEQLDGALDWLESLGAVPQERETGNPLTSGRRFDPRQLTAALVRAGGEVRLATPFEQADILATGGFSVRLARERGLLLRGNPWSEGDGLEYGLARGGGTAGDLAEYYGRALPAAVADSEYVGSAQLYGRSALVLDDAGREFFPGEPSWSENDLVQAFPHGAAWYVTDARARRERVRNRTVGEMVETAGALGGDVRPAEELPFALPASPKLGEPPFVAVRVRAGVTHTLGGLRIDERARVVGADGLFAAGVDAGGIASGGYASGLAQALVLGRLAAESSAG